MIESVTREWAGLHDRDALVAELCRDLATVPSEFPPGTVRSVVAATRAFVVTDGCSDDAAREVGPMMMAVGRRAAVRGHSVVRLRHDLQYVVAERSRCADSFLALVEPACHRDLLRRGLARFLDQVRRAVLAGHRQAHALLELGPDARRAEVARALFTAGSVPDDLLVLAGIDASASYVPVVWVTGAGAARAARELPGVLLDPSGRCVLVPAGEVAGLALEAGECVVTGPPRLVGTIGDALHLARHAAAAMQAGLVTRSSAVTACSDIADELLLAGSPGLSGLLADKYLAGLLSLKLQRRVGVGEVLLTWLETRAPYSEIAERHHVSRQTVNDRIQTGKELLGPALDDPRAHAAIVVALHASLARWSEEAAARASRP